MLIKTKKEFVNEVYRSAIRSIPEIYIVLTDNLSKWGLGSLFSRAIKEHTHGNYNHAMLMREPGMVISQDWQLREKLLDRYLHGTHRVKLIKVPTNRQEKILINETANKLLNKRPQYDWLGILGFLFNKRTINFQSRYYCSELVLYILREAGKYNGSITQSPADINRFYKDFGWVCTAIYDPFYAKLKRT